MQTEPKLKKSIVNSEHLNQVAQNLSQYDVLNFKLPRGVHFPLRSRLSNKPQVTEVSPHSVDDAIDLNKLLACFPALRMKKGMVLDYILHLVKFNRTVLAYARKIDEPPFTTVAQYEQTFVKDNENASWMQPFLDVIIWDNSPEGFFDISLFVLIVDAIYLKHTRFLYTPAQIAQLQETKTDPLGWDYKEDLGVLSEMDTNVYFEPRVPQKNGCTVSFLSESVANGIQQVKVIFIDNVPQRVKYVTIIPHHSPMPVHRKYLTCLYDDGIITPCKK